MLRLSCLPLSFELGRALEGKCVFSVPWAVSNDTCSWLLRGFRDRAMLEFAILEVTTGPLIEEILQNNYMHLLL